MSSAGADTIRDWPPGTDPATGSRAVSFTLVFSIVVPTYARPAHLARCLEALGRLAFPPDTYEVVIVDDGPSSETAAQVAAAAGALSCRVQYVSQTRQGPAKARNAGARAATGRYLAFTDDDCTPEPEWLHALEQSLTQSTRTLAGGTTINALPDVRCSVASQVLIDFLYAYHEQGATPSRFFTSNNMAVHADAFRDVGGFDETFPLAAGEDREFCERWRQHGGTLVHAEHAIVRHWHNLTIGRFVRQHFNYGRGAHFLHRSRVRQSTGAASAWPRREPLAFYAQMLRYPFSCERAPRALQLSSLLALSQAAYITGYLYQRVR